MRANYRLLAIATAIATGIAVGPSALTAQVGTPTAPQSAADSAYLTRLAALQRGDTTVDLSALRRQFALTTFYAPYDTDAGEQRRHMWALLETQDAPGAGTIADSLLGANYLDLEAHVGAGVSAGARGDSLAASRHFAIARAILRSIASTGDGRSKDRPLFVLSPAEEYSYLNAVGLRRVGFQALDQCAGGRACDRLEVAPRAGGEKFDLFFDVSLPKARLDRQFQQADKPK